MKDGKLRMGASQWLPGKPLGPFTYYGVRRDDPSDVVPHEDRRELRGARLFAAWVSHYDAREQNTMSTWMAKNADEPTSSPGHVRHWYLDFGDCFGSAWQWDDYSRRLGRSYYFDPGDILLDLFTFGALERPWERATWPVRIFPYFTAEEFDAEAWKTGYPNPAFARMTELDGAWAARIIAHFTESQIRAIVNTALLPKPGPSEYLARTLLGRRTVILRRYLKKLSPIGNVTLQGDDLCGTDLARSSGAFPDATFAYRAALFPAGGHAGGDAGGDAGGGAGARTARTLDVHGSDTGRVCVTIPHRTVDGGPREADDAPSRYIVVRIRNGQAEGPLDARLYDLGAERGYRLVGLRRPEK